VLVDDRFGAEVTDRLVEPLLGGVYAGQARQISLQAALPGLYDRLAGSGGSLLRATAQVLGSSAVTPSGGMAAEPAPVFASVSGGLGRFVERLAELLTDSGRVELRMRCTVRSVDRLSHAFRLTTGPVSSPEFLEVDSVVLAAPASKSAAMLRRVAPAASADLAGIPSASIAIVTLAFEGSAVQGRLRGSGLLIPPVDGFTVKAMTFSSNKWPGVGGPDVLLRASLGRYGEQHALQREDSELVTLVRGELATLTGLRVEPLDVDVQRWGGGLPQYEVGHGDRVRRIRAAVAEHPGLAICGAALDGVGIPACIASARVAVDRLVGSPLGTDLSATDRSASGGLGSGGLASGGLGSDRLASDRLPHSPSGGGH
jgi:oxygen-dependent protoporphyrinogen oxidase